MPRPIKYPRLARFMKASMDRADKITAEELGKRSGLGRAVVGRIVRGEQLPAPDQASALVKNLPFTMAELLEECGYEIGLSPQRRVPEALADAWAKMAPHVRDSLLELAQAAANPNQASGEQS